jgi:hypothetical protein
MRAAATNMTASYGVAHRLVHDNLLFGMVFAHRLHPVRCIPVRPMRKLSHTRANRLVDLIALLFTL